MSENQWRVVDTPLLQPRDPQAMIFADWGPWCASLNIAIHNARWLASTGRDVWIEGPEKTWMDMDGRSRNAPPSHYRRKPTTGI